MKKHYQSYRLHDRIYVNQYVACHTNVIHGVKMSKRVNLRMEDYEYELLNEYCKKENFKTISDVIRHFIRLGIEGGRSSSAELEILAEIKRVAEHNLRISSAGFASVVLLRDKMLGAGNSIEERKAITKEVITHSLGTGANIVSLDRQGEFDK